MDPKQQETSQKQNIEEKGRHNDASSKEGGNVPTNNSQLQQEKRKKDKRKYQDKGGKGKGNGERKPRSAQNDVSWYIPDAQLAADAGRLSFNNALGLPMPYKVAAGSDPSFTVPGIARLRMRPTFGVSDNANSAVNVASRRFYSFLRHANSGARNYGAPDAMIYLLCVDSVFAYHAYLCRIYGTAAQFSATNRYWGDALLRANFVNPNNVRANLANLRYYINLFATKVNRSLITPSGFGFFKRHMWLFSNYFQDSPVNKAQVYAHVPAGFYRYNPVHSETGGAAEANTFPAVGRLQTVDDLVAYGDGLLNPLLMDDDIATISGDILKAYGDKGANQLNTIAEDYAVAPTYSEEILGQIHNTELVGLQLEGYTVEQRVGSTAEDIYLYCAPSYQETDFAPFIAAVMGHRMDSFSGTPTVEEVIINSRNMVNLSYDSIAFGALEDVKLTSCGLDVCEAFEVLTMQADGSLQVAGTSLCVPVSLTTPDQSAPLSQFDWAPRCVRVGQNEETGEVSTYEEYWDYNNTTNVDDYVIDKLHQTALLGAFNVPGVANAYKA